MFELPSVHTREKTSPSSQFVIPEWSLERRSMAVSGSDMIIAICDRMSIVRSVLTIIL